MEKSTALCLAHSTGIEDAWSLGFLRRSHLSGLGHFLSSWSSVTPGGLGGFGGGFGPPLGLGRPGAAANAAAFAASFSFFFFSFYPSFLSPCDLSRPFPLPFPSWSWQHPLALVRLGPRPCLNNHLVVSTEVDGQSQLCSSSSSIARSTFSHNHAVVRL